MVPPPTYTRCRQPLRCQTASHRRSSSIRCHAIVDRKLLRRELLGVLSLAGVDGIADRDPFARAEEEAVVSIAAGDGDAAAVVHGAVEEPAPPKPMQWRRYDVGLPPVFSISVPVGFQREEEGTDAPQTSSSFLGMPSSSRIPLKTQGTLAHFNGAIDRSAIQVIVAFIESRQLRPTFQQINDISAYGSPEDVALLILPRRGVRRLVSKSTEIALPPRDTGTVRGTFVPPPRSYYEYAFSLAVEDPEGSGGASEVDVRMSLAALRGRVYCAVVSATPGAAVADAVITDVASSFRLSK